MYVCSDDIIVSDRLTSESFSNPTIYIGHGHRYTGETWPKYRENVRIIVVSKSFCLVAKEKHLVRKPSIKNQPFGRVPPFFQNASSQDHLYC